MLNESVHAASSAARITGRYSGFAPGHHRVDGDLLDGALHEIGRDHRDDLVGRSGGAFEHAQHAGLGGSDDGKTVGPASIEQGLGLVLERGDLDAPTAQDGAAEAHREHVDHVGVDGQRAAPRPLFGQVRAERRLSRRASPTPGVTNRRCARPRPRPRPGSVSARSRCRGGTRQRGRRRARRRSRRGSRDRLACTPSAPPRRHGCSATRVRPARRSGTRPSPQQRGRRGGSWPGR